MLPLVGYLALILRISYWSRKSLGKVKNIVFENIKYFGQLLYDYTFVQQSAGKSVRQKFRNPYLLGIHISLNHKIVQTWSVLSLVEKFEVAIDFWKSAIHNNIVHKLEMALVFQREHSLMMSYFKVDRGVQSEPQNWIL